MNIYYFASLFLLTIIISYPLPSQEIWEKTKLYLQDYQLDSIKNYFIYDEKNYTGYEPSSSQMKQLYQMQKNLYDKYTLNN